MTTTDNSDKHECRQDVHTFSVYRNTKVQVHNNKSKTADKHSQRKSRYFCIKTEYIKHF